MNNDIEILMFDGCSRKEAERFLKNGTIIIDDFEESFDSYMIEWDIDADVQEEYRKMIETKTPLTDWGIVSKDNKIYYIMYVN